jgi:CRP/FNR family cyclic AMP-dependent transcriptional regulator
MPAARPDSSAPASQSVNGSAAAPGPGGAVLARELLDEMVRMGQVKSFPKNTIVVLEGEPAEALYVIVGGQVRVFVSDEDGKEAELNVLGPGEYFGELMLGSQKRTASVRTLVPSKLAMITRAEFEHTLAARPDLAFHLIQTLIHRIRTLTDNVSSLALMDVYGRVARLFNEQARDEGGRRVVPGMSQQAIAERVSASRGMINRILKDLTDGGYIEVSREAIVLLRALPKRW